MTIDDGVTGQPWTEAEVTATVAVYFQMLRMQELGQTPNKSEHNRRLAELLPARNLSAIEYKHRNISAVLNLFDVQSLDGYKPLPNFQQLLVRVVGEALAGDRVLDDACVRGVEMPAEVPLMDGFGDFLVEAPQPQRTVREQIGWFERTPIRRDYLERESRNRSLGLAGELLVIEFEQHRLHSAGQKKLAERIEHVSKTRGDGTGYDVLSFDFDGRERFIEVKTTSYSAETPFYISPNEVNFSDEKRDQFQLYRLFGFRKKPKMFVLPGAVAMHCNLDTATYRATLLSRP